MSYEIYWRIDVWNSTNQNGINEFAKQIEAAMEVGTTRVDFVGQKILCLDRLHFNQSVIDWDNDHPHDDRIWNYYGTSKLHRMFVKRFDVVSTKGYLNLFVRGFGVPFLMWHDLAKKFGIVIVCRYFDEFGEYLGMQVCDEDNYDIIEEVLTNERLSVRQRINQINLKLQIKHPNWKPYLEKVKASYIHLTSK